jgi:hypothetical protein
MFLNIASTTMLNMLVDSRSPCLTPDCAVNSSLKSLFTLILTLLFAEVSAVSQINFNGTLYCLRQSNILSLATESNTCVSLGRYYVHLYYIHSILNKFVTL